MPKRFATKKPRHPPDKMGIYRGYESKRGGYYLHVTIRRNGIVYQKYFMEKRCGGEENTLTLARAWRDTIITKHPPMLMAQFCAIVRANNTSGVPGVYRAVRRKVAKNGQVWTSVYWQARTPLVDGKLRIQNFSVRTYGEDAARQCAIDARLRGLRELDDLVFRADSQPLPVSTVDDLAVLEASLQLAAQRRQRRHEERLNKISER
ncbi:hypothetical protein C7C56_027390 [Massilia glaciei]|uniref:AP2 domain-containing protein n=2 Tax=Massilia glaciei TaxID=1524097 RepID=A0A2U2H8R0_9BURK|nr:hypothetical protein C7C56_027390 [Massilia glaciei]